MEPKISTIPSFTQLLPFPMGAEEGPLASYQFAIKDVFDLKGFRTQAGNPDYFAQSPVADTTAEAVSLLQQAGAKLVGKTHTDELGGSLFGINEHYGTPLNTRAPDRVPGGSSSGSASVVAANLVDFALGADTSGSVRAPASFCGLYGFRPTLGRISTKGVLPIAPLFDTVGVFARDSYVLSKVLAVYGMTETIKIKGFKTVSPLMDRLPPFYRAAFGEDLHTIKELTSYETPLVLGEDTLKEWSKGVRTIAMHDLWQVHKSWILKENPSFGKLIHDRIEVARSISEEEYKMALTKAKEAKKRITDLLDDGEVLVFPTVHDIPPLVSSSVEQLKEFALKASQHTCLATLSGCPEITIPLQQRSQGATIGISFMAREGNDASLAHLAADIETLFAAPLSGYKGNQSSSAPKPEFFAV